jgi:elongation factor 2
VSRVLGIGTKGPADQIGAITGVISGKRGKLVNIEQREVLTIVEGEIPAAETLDLSEKMRGATAGRAVWNTYFKLWWGVPTDEHIPVLVEQIRKRKGLPIEPPKASEFIDNE